MSRLRQPSREEVTAIPGESAGPLRHRWVWIVYALLFAASIPWYLPPGSAPELWLGVPHWFLLSLIPTLGVAVFTAYVIRRCWAEEDPVCGASDEEGAA